MTNIYHRNKLLFAKTHIFLFASEEYSSFMTLNDHVLAPISSTYTESWTSIILILIVKFSYYFEYRILKVEEKKMKRSGKWSLFAPHDRGPVSLFPFKYLEYLKEYKSLSSWQVYTTLDIRISRRFN